MSKITVFRPTAGEFDALGGTVVSLSEDVAALDLAAERVANKDQPGGYVGLDAGGNIVIPGEDPLTINAAGMSTPGAGMTFEAGGDGFIAFKLGDDIWLDVDAGVRIVDAHLTGPNTVIDGLVLRISPDGAIWPYKPAADTNAARGDALQAAKSAASAGDTIFVGAGAYDTNDLLKDGVCWQFAAGATLRYTGGGAASLFDDGPNGANGAVACTIGGDGEFVSEAGRLIHLVNASAVTMHCRRLEADSTTGVRAVFVGGAGPGVGPLLTLEADEIISSGGALDSTGGTMVVRAGRVYAGGNFAVENDGGIQRVWAREIEAAGSSEVITIASGDEGTEISIWAERIINSTGGEATIVNSTSELLAVSGATFEGVATDLFGPVVINGCARSDGAAFTGSAPTYIQAASILAALLGVDGTGSGLDADTVDGQHASAFASASHAHAWDRWLDPTAYHPAVTNPAVPGVRNGHPLLRFSDTDGNGIAAEWKLRIPDEYDGGNVAVEIHWTSEDQTSGVVKFDVAVEAVGATELDSDSFDAAVEGSEVACHATNGVPSLTTVVLTPADLDGAGAGDTIRLRLTRDNTTSGSNMANDAQVLGVCVRSA